MDNITQTYVQEIDTRSKAGIFVHQVLKTAYPVAMWRLPKTEEQLILVDITQTIQEASIEKLERCFVFNAYDNSHPPKPTVLSGDIIIRIEGEKAISQFSPALSDSALDDFFDAIGNNSSHIPPKSADLPEEVNFKEMVTEAVEKIRAHEVEKVVLSRYQDYQLSPDFDPLSLFDKLSESYTNAFCYLLQTEETGLWMGATPEKLIAIESDRYFSTDALAGTQPLPEDNDLGQIAWRQKEIEEQAMVSRYIINCFKEIRLREFDEIGPKTAKAGNLVHLKTEFKVDMEATNSPLLGSTMLNLLHPTSAVCGYPRSTANDFIRNHEHYERELYAGFLGPAGFNGNTNLFVNLRCMKIHGNTARLYAGAGITEDSVPEKEYIETQQKMQTLLKVLNL